MFTKIGEFLKPIFGKRDHIPLQAITPIDADDHGKINKGKNKKRRKKREYLSEDTTDLSLNAIEAMLKEVMIDNIDLYADVKYIVKELKKRKIEHIKVRSDETPLIALIRVAKNLSIETRL